MSSGHPFPALPSSDASPNMPSNDQRDDQLVDTASNAQEELPLLGAARQRYATTVPLSRAPLRRAASLQPSLASLDQRTWTGSGDEPNEPPGHADAPAPLTRAHRSTQGLNSFATGSASPTGIPPESGDWQRQSYPAERGASSSASASSSLFPGAPATPDTLYGSMESWKAGASPIEAAPESANSSWQNQVAPMSASQLDGIRRVFGGPITTEPENLDAAPVDATAQPAHSYSWPAYMPNMTAQRANPVAQPEHPVSQPANPFSLPVSPLAQSDNRFGSIADDFTQFMDFMQPSPSDTLWSDIVTDNPYSTVDPLLTSTVTSTNQQGPASPSSASFGGGNTPLQSVESAPSVTAQSPTSVVGPQVLGPDWQLPRNLISYSQTHGPMVVPGTFSPLTLPRQRQYSQWGNTLPPAASLQSISQFNRFHGTVPQTFGAELGLREFTATHQTLQENNEVRSFHGSCTWSRTWALSNSRSRGWVRWRLLVGANLDGIIPPTATVTLKIPPTERTLLEEFQLLSNVEFTRGYLTGEHPQRSYGDKDPWRIRKLMMMTVNGASGPERVVETWAELGLRLVQPIATHDLRSIGVGS